MARTAMSMMMLRKLLCDSYYNVLDEVIFGLPRQKSYIQDLKELSQRFTGKKLADTDTTIQRELIYKLSTGNATRTQLVKSLPHDLSKVDKFQHILDTVVPEVVITHLSHIQPSNDASNSASMSDSDKRKAEAHERQAAIVAKMKAHQSQLTEKRFNDNIRVLLMQCSSGKSALVFCSTRKGAQVLAQTAMNHDYSNPFIKSSEQQERLREASMPCGDKQIQSYILYSGTNFGRDKKKIAEDNAQMRSRFERDMQVQLPREVERQV
ncbi:DExH-box ATP-dependent RNA helicase DExH17 [Tanacetum coccineum]